MHLGGVLAMTRRCLTVFLIPVVLGLCTTMTSAQGLLGGNRSVGDGGSGGSAAQAAPGTVRIRIQGGNAVAEQFAALVTQGTCSRDATGGYIVELADPVAAVAFFRELAQRLETEWSTDKAIVDVPVERADPRSIRAVLGREVLLRDHGVGIWCRLDPPAIRLVGAPDAVAPVVARVKELDVAPPSDQKPESVVRKYLECWLMRPEGMTGPDTNGMYALTTAEAQSRISDLEFGLVVAETGGSPEGAEGTRGPGEIVAVYEPKLSSDGNMAVVTYSVAWPLPSADWFGANQSGPVQTPPQNLGGAGSMSQQVPADNTQSPAMQVAAANMQSYQSLVPGSNADYQSCPMPAGRALDGRRRFVTRALLRGEALVVRQPDGTWRLPMTFDEATRTWLMPLSPTLLARLAPELAPVVAPATGNVLPDLDDRRIGGTLLGY
jgi:hypothetical protein